MNRSVIVLLVASIFLHYGCGTTDTGSPGSSGTIQQLFPLAVGDSWSYQVIEYFNDGSIKANQTYLLSVPSSSDYQGHTAYTFMANGDSSIKYYYDGTTDIITIDGNSDPVVGFHLLQRIGDSYTFIDTIEPGNIKHKEVLVLRSINEQVKVAAGTFLANRYDQLRILGTSDKPDTDVIDSKYYSSGIGLVKENEWVTSGKLYQKYAVELKQYTVK